MPTHGKIDYLEFPAHDLHAVKNFFTQAFNWSFIDYGEEYTAFSNAGIDGGFYKSAQRMSAENGALIVFYSADLNETQSNIEKAGGVISTPTFSFPGGKRFHFRDPTDNEYAVWSEA